MPLRDLFVSGTKEDGALLPVVGAGIGRSKVRIRSDAAVKN